MQHLIQQLGALLTQEQITYDDLQDLISGSAALSVAELDTLLIRVDALHRLLLVCRQHQAGVTVAPALPAQGEV